MSSARISCADVSHELRTPIAVIQSSCEQALAQPRSEEEYRKALEDIRKQAKRMAALSSQMLELSRTVNTADSLQREEVDLAILCESVCEEAEERAARRRIAVERDLPSELLAWVDEMQWMRLLVNLLNNAVRYGKDGGRVCVRLSGEGETIRLTV